MMKSTFTKILSLIVILVALLSNCSSCLASELKPLDKQPRSYLMDWLADYAKDGKNSIEFFQKNGCNIAILTQYEMEGIKFPKRQVSLEEAKNITNETIAWAKENSENQARLEEILRVFGPSALLEWDDEHKDVVISGYFIEMTIKKNDNRIFTLAPLRPNIDYKEGGLDIMKSSKHTTPTEFWDYQVQRVFVIDKASKEVGFMTWHHDESGITYTILIQLEPEGTSDGIGGLCYASPKNMETLGVDYDAKDFLIKFATWINITYSNPKLNGDYAYYMKDSD